jgi:hypothetical protein
MCVELLKISKIKKSELIWERLRFRAIVTRMPKTIGIL